MLHYKKQQFERDVYMKTLKSLKVFAVCGMATVMMAGCFGPSVEDKALEGYQNAIQKETKFKAYGKDLEKLQQDKNELYEEIKEDGKKDTKVVLEQIEEAIKKTKDQKGLLTKQKKELDTAYEVVKDQKDNVQKIKEEKVKKAAVAMQKAYEDRYKAYNDYEKNFKKANEEEELLYGILKNSSTSMKEITNQTNKLNTYLDKAIQSSNTFNEKTKEFNASKDKFIKEMEK